MLDALVQEKFKMFQAAAVTFRNRVEGEWSNLLLEDAEVTDLRPILNASTTLKL